KAGRGLSDEISDVRGILTKENERARGTALASVTVKMGSGIFLIGLSSAEADLKRNVSLMRESTWLNIALVLDSGRRAILAIEKGSPGNRSFADAFARWGDAYVTQGRPQSPQERDRLIEQSPTIPSYRRG